jgi:hypothetical protein
MSQIIVATKYEKVAIRSTTMIATAPSHQQRLVSDPARQ